MNAGYTLAPVNTNPNAPDWAKSVLAATQPGLDFQYLHGSGNSLDHYYAMAEAWKTTETQARAQSADPEHYSPQRFTLAVPQREIYDYSDEKGGLYSRFEQDPAVVAPVLDPYVKPAPTQPGISGAGAASAAAQQAAMFSMLVNIQMAVTAIKGKLGI